MSAHVATGERSVDAAGSEATVRETLGLARPAGRRLVLASLLGAGAIGAGIGLLATSAWLISRASQHPPESALALAVVAVQFFGLSRGLFRYGQRLVGHDAAFQALADLRVHVYTRLESLAPAGLPALRSGDLLARFVHDVDSLQDLLVRVIQPFAIAVLVGVATVSLVWWILPAAGLILLLALVIAATLLPWLTGSLARRTEARQATARGELTAAVVDLVRGARELSAYGAIDDQLMHTGAIDAELARVERSSARTAGVGQGLATLLPGLAMVGALLVGVSAVRAGRLDGVLLAVIALVPLAAFELATGLPAATQVLQRVRRSLGRTLAVLHADPLVKEPANAVPLPCAPHTLRVRGLRFRYGDEGPWALDGVDLDLSPGRRIALVGRSGAGKSTLADVLLRFLPYEVGSAMIDGVELREMSGEDCRRVIGLVAQDAHIFNASVEENLRLARRDATAEELRSALQRARLLEWTEELPDGLGTEVGEFGSRMSGGQRQRLAIARALLADFPMLVLDEPGEHLDTATADALVSDVLEATSEQSVLLITHRLAGLEAVDEVIVLDAGRAVERGTHAQLLTRRGSYAAMWQREVSER
ncbi:MAG: thiol reductant ABC exporter subunit CydC [Solirubrobacteraceae bacterium]